MYLKGFKMIPASDNVGGRTDMGRKDKLESSQQQQRNMTGRGSLRQQNQNNTGDSTSTTLRQRLLCTLAPPFQKHPRCQHPNCRLRASHQWCPLAQTEELTGEGQSQTNSIAKKHHQQRTNNHYQHHSRWHPTSSLSPNLVESNNTLLSTCADGKREPKRSRSCARSTTSWLH